MFDIVAVMQKITENEDCSDIYTVNDGDIIYEISAYCVSSWIDIKIIKPTKLPDDEEHIPIPMFCWTKKEC